MLLISCWTQRGQVALGDVDGLFQMFATATARTRATLDLQSAEQLGYACGVYSPFLSE